jgi:hypothetical protein
VYYYYYKLNRNYTNFGEHSTNSTFGAAVTRSELIHLIIVKRSRYFPLLTPSKIEFIQIVVVLAYSLSIISNKYFFRINLKRN